MLKKYALHMAFLIKIPLRYAEDNWENMRLSGRNSSFGALGSGLPSDTKPVTQVSLRTGVNPNSQGP